MPHRCLGCWSRAEGSGIAGSDYSLISPTHFLGPDQRRLKHGAFPGGETVVLPSR
jgi:hypothetical protein